MMAVKFYMLQYNLFFLVVRFSKLEILMTAKLIEFFFLRMLHLGPLMVLDYFIFILKTCDVFRPFVCFLHTYPYEIYEIVCSFQKSFILHEKIFGQFSNCWGYLKIMYKIDIVIHWKVINNKLLFLFISLQFKILKKYEIYPQQRKRAMRSKNKYHKGILSEA